MAARVMRWANIYAKIAVYTTLSLFSAATIAHLRDMKQLRKTHQEGTVSFERVRKLCLEDYAITAFLVAPIVGVSWPFLYGGVISSVLFHEIERRQRIKYLDKYTRKV
jgi:hypothetical protein